MDPLYQRAIHGHSGPEHFRPNFYSRQILESRRPQKLQHIDYAKYETAIEERGLAPGSFDQKQRSTTSARHASQPLGQKNEQTVQGSQTLTLMSVHGAIYVVDMEGAQNKNPKFDRALNGCIVSFDTIPEDHMKKVIHIRDMVKAKTTIDGSVVHKPSKRTPVATWSKKRSTSMQRFTTKIPSWRETLCATEVPHKSGNSRHHEKKKGNARHRCFVVFVRSQSNSERKPANHPPMVR